MELSKAMPAELQIYMCVWLVGLCVCLHQNLIIEDYSARKKESNALGMQSNVKEGKLYANECILYE